MMFKRAQDMLGMAKDGVRNTLRVVADLAESVGVPQSVTSLINRDEGNGHDVERWSTEQQPAPPPVTPSAVAPQPAPTIEQSTEAETPKPRRTTGKRRPVVGDRDRSKGIRPLEVDDAIGGSTYLARIIWSLGVADLEGLGPQRPADIARMVMSRSAVSLEPPNVARYIRRSKPTTIAVDHQDGGSNFYKLNASGKKLFQENFGLN